MSRNDDIKVFCSREFRKSKVFQCPICYTYVRGTQESSSTSHTHTMKLPCRTYDIEGLRYAELNKKRKLLYKYLAGKKLKDFDLKY